MSSEMNDKAASTAREELLESRLRIERLGEKLNALQKQVLPASLPASLPLHWCSAC